MLFSTYLVRSYYIVLKKSCLRRENQAEKSKNRLDKVKDGTINLNDFLGWLAKGEIGVCTTPKRIKTEEVEEEFKEKNEYIIEPTLKSKACLKCLYFTIIIFDLCRYLEYFSYLYTINQTE